MRLKNIADVRCSPVGQLASRQLGDIDAVDKDLSAGDLIDSDFTEANLLWVEFTYATVTDSIFEDANLKYSTRFNMTVTGEPFMTSP